MLRGKEVILMRNAIEITMTFNRLISERKLDDVTKTEKHEDVLNTITELAGKFMKKFPIECWCIPGFSYTEEIKKFAEEELIKLYGNKGKEIFFIHIWNDKTDCIYLFI